MPATLDQIRNTRPATPNHLWHWIHKYTGVRVGRSHVCRNHRPPLEWLAKQWLERPPLVLILGARGSGKSFLEAILTHMESRFTRRLGTRILGGSKAQSLQIYEALSRGVRDASGTLGGDGESILKLLTDKARYRNGSQVSILAASSTSVRGPHVPSLRLDEVDEIDPEIREAAMGMAMAMDGVPASVSMTSTWHRIGGPMSELMERASDGEFPSYTTCTFDVLERCPESRSGPYVGGHDCYRDCPSCPLVKWCHAERDRNGDRPLAKLSDGHYAIDSLIQKVRGVSVRTFESDYLCKGPRADGLWFPEFDDDNVREDAEYDPRYPVHCSVDSGVWTGAVWFQVRHHGDRHVVSALADYLAENIPAEANAGAILPISATRCGSARIRYSTDPAGGSRNPVGPTVIGEYERAGLKNAHGIDRWPHSTVADSLAVLEGLIKSANGTRNLIVHSRCKHLIQALKNYRRAKRGGQWMDWPEDPQHPFEDLVDALRGGLKLELPEGRKPQPRFARPHAGRVIY